MGPITKKHLSEPKLNSIYLQAMTRYDSIVLENPNFVLIYRPTVGNYIVLNKETLLIDYITPSKTGALKWMGEMDL